MSTQPPDNLPISYTFTLESLHILNTRSKHQDTDFVSFTLLHKPAQGVVPAPRTLTKALGNVNNGLHPIGLVFPKIIIGPRDTVTINYIIANVGHKPAAQAQQAMQTSGSKLSLAGTVLVDVSKYNPVSLTGSGIEWLSKALASLFDGPNCDGVVAISQQSLSYDDLFAATFHGPNVFPHEHNGTDSPQGCGSNSVYDVTMRIERDK